MKLLIKGRAITFVIPCPLKINFIPSFSFNFSFWYLKSFFAWLFFLVENEIIFYSFYLILWNFILVDQKWRKNLFCQFIFMTKLFYFRFPSPTVSTKNSVKTCFSPKCFLAFDNEFTYVSYKSTLRIYIHTCIHTHIHTWNVITVKFIILKLISVYDRILYLFHIKNENYQKYIFYNIIYE